MILASFNKILFFLAEHVKTMKVPEVTPKILDIKEESFNEVGFRRRQGQFKAAIPQVPLKIFDIPL
jgi:hypothetical protein